MHTHVFEKDGERVVVNVNSDFSGDAIVDFGLDRKSVTIPAFFLPLLGRNAALDDAISALEDLYVKESSGQ